MKIALLTFIHLFSKNKKETEIMKKICILICMVCLSLCLFSGSMDAMTVNATENSIENEIQQAYLEAIEAQNKRNNELELLIDKVDESWLIEDENGKMSWAITEEEKENIDVELVSFLDHSIKEKNELIDDSIIVQSDGEILLTEEAEDDYFIQSGDFYVVQKYKKVWFATIWIGFDVIANNPSAAIVLASAGILVDLAYLITDISILWKNLDAACAIALTYCRSLHEVVRQLGTLLMGIPKYILTAVEFMWRTIVVGSTGTVGIILSIAKLGLPSAAHGIDIINNASKGRGTTFHYTVLFYSGYTLH